LRKGLSRMPGRSSDSEKPSNRGRKKISVLLVDDHSLVRRGFRLILEDEPDLEVIGEAGDGSEAVDLVRRLKPNVVLMDYSLPGMNGLVALGRIVKSCPETAVLMLSMHSEPSQVRQAARVGARGYLVKNAANLELVSAIRLVASGELVFETKGLDFDARKAESRSPLSARELEVLQLIVNGKSNRQIAAELKLSTNTVASHRANIMQALRLKKTAELVVYALRFGLANLP
jgi:two-component system, NarL family, response regulator NreC